MSEAEPSRASDTGSPEEDPDALVAWLQTFMDDTPL